MTKKIMVFLIVMFLFSSLTKANSEVDGLYYSPKMVKNAIFVWDVTQSVNFYENIPQGANFSVTLKDDLYPGPLSEENLSSVYASVKVNGEKYTGEGFPLFWHIYRLENEGTTNTSIREEFENEPYLFNVTDGPMDTFYVNFTIRDNSYILFVEFEIDPNDGLTTRYYEHFFDSSTGTVEDSIIELVFIDYYLEEPEETTTSNNGTTTINNLPISIAFGIIVSFAYITLKRWRKSY